MSDDPWVIIFVLFVITLVYSFVLSVGELPNIHRPLDCPKHPGTTTCRCRGNLPKR